MRGTKLMVTLGQKVVALLLVTLLSWCGVAYGEESEVSIQQYQKYFAILEGGGPIDEVLDPSRWPKHELLASYLELEIFFHPQFTAETSRLATFLKRWPHHPHASRVRSLMESQVTKLGDNQEALDWYDSNPPGMQSSRARYLQLLVAKKRLKEAESLWLTLYRAGTRFSKDVESSTKNFNSLLTAHDFEQRARKLMGKEPTESFLALIQHLPKSRQNYLLALIEAKGARDQFQFYVDQLSSQDATLAELWEARIRGLSRAGLQDAAAKLLLGPEGVFLSKADRQNLRFRLGQIFLANKEVDKSFGLFDLNVQEMVSGSDDSLWGAAWSAHLQGDTTKARARFIQLAEKAGSHLRRAQGAWWAAKTAQDDQEKQQWLLRAMRYPGTFYGLLAVEEKNAGLFSLQDPESACQVSKSGPLGLEVEKLSQLQQVGRDYYNSGEIEGLADKFKLPLTDQLCLALDYGATDLAIRVADKLGYQGKTFWQGLYPLPSWSPGWGWKLEPALIWGMVRQESKFFHRVQSSAQAQGLLQLIPSTAQQEAEMAGFPPSNPFQLQLPRYNLALGQSYMMRMLRQFNGDLVLALSAYNAGPSRASKWQQERSHFDAVTFIENIPFTETKNYVKLVLHGMSIYQRRLHGQGSLTALIGEGQPGNKALWLSAQ